MRSISVFDYEKEFWGLLKRYLIFLLYDEELLNHLPREGLAKILEEEILNLRRTEENLRAKDGTLFARIPINHGILIAESLLEQIKEGKKKLKIKSN
jgi:hypothetical protein